MEMDGWMDGNVSSNSFTTSMPLHWSMRFLLGLKIGGLIFGILCWEDLACNCNGLIHNVE